MGDELKNLFNKASNYVAEASDYVSDTIDSTVQMYKGAVNHVDEHGVDWDRTGQFAVKGFYKGIASAVGSIADGGIWVYNNAVQDVVNAAVGTKLEEAEFSAKAYLSENIYQMPMGPGGISPAMTGISNHLVPENDFEKGVEATAQIGTEVGFFIATSAGVHAGVSAIKHSSTVSNFTAAIKHSPTVEKLTHGALTHSANGSSSVAGKILSGSYEVYDKGNKATKLLNRAVAMSAAMPVEADSRLDAKGLKFSDSENEEVFGPRTAASAYSRHEQSGVMSQEFSQAAHGPQQPTPERPFGPQPEDRDINAGNRNFVFLNPST